MTAQVEAAAKELFESFDALTRRGLPHVEGDRQRAIARIAAIIERHIYVPDGAV